MFKFKIPATHPLAVPSSQTKWYPPRDYVERDQIRRAINREMYCGDVAPKPSNFSTERWDAVMKRFRNEHFDRL